MKTLTQTELETLVRNNIQQLVDNEEMFTAYDITQLCRLPHDGDVYYVNHLDVRLIVHDIMRGVLIGNYISTPCSILNSVAVLIYHHYTSSHLGYDPQYIINEYENAGLTYSSPTGQSVPSWSSNPCDDDDDEEEDKDTVKLDRWDRLRVPVRFTRSAGLNSGDHVRVEFNRSGNTIEIFYAHGYDFSHSVDYHGNIRIKIKGAKSKRYKLNSVKYRIEAEPVV